jgi:NAD(P)-dependent dehydrogenase (short-subunit alcohol dehydrogenase family)
MQDRIVIVTGASGGIGRTVTERWLAAGARVVAVASSNRSLDGLGAHERLATGAFDLTSEPGARDVVRFAHATFGVPDTLIHLVGGFDMGPIGDEGMPSIWDRMMRLNADSAFHAFRAVLPAFRERGGGSIVGLSSRSAVTAPAQMAAYAASKAALTALVKSMAAELRDEEIRVNLIATSTVDTPANRAAMGDKAAGKWVTPDQIADATLFLASDAASAISGTVLDVFGKA